MKHKGYNNITNSLGNSTAQKFGYNGKELNEELGLQWHDFDARNYDASLGRWMNIDPLAEEFYEWSPYNFVYNSPIRFIDPTGMGPQDVIINGELADEAFSQLQKSVSSELTLTIDKKGKVRATVNEGVTLEEGSAASHLLKATEDSKRIVNVDATDKNTVAKSGNLFTGGAFGGSTVNDDGSITATQTVNPNHTKIKEDFIGQKEGVTILHEVVEAYIGAVESPGAKPNSQEYVSAHKKANNSDSRRNISFGYKPEISNVNYTTLRGDVTMYVTKGRKRKVLYKEKNFKLQKK